MKIEEAERNIKEFMDKHGVEGFLKLYFAKYLLKLIVSELKSKLGTELAEGISRDPGTIFYYKDNKIEKLSDIEKYKEQLSEECKKKANEVVKELKKDNKFKDLFKAFKGDYKELRDPKLEERFEKKMHEILEDWKEGD